MLYDSLSHHSKLVYFIEYCKSCKIGTPEIIVVIILNIKHCSMTIQNGGQKIDEVSPSVFRYTSTPMEVSP